MSAALPPTVLLLVQAGIAHDAGAARAVASCKQAIDRSTGAHARVPKAFNLMCTLQIAAPFAQAYPAVAAELNTEFLAARKTATTAFTAVHVKYLTKRLAALQADRVAGHAHLVQQLLTWGVAGHKTACALLPATTPAITALSDIKTAAQYAALVLAAMGNRDTVTVPFRAALLAALGDKQALYDTAQVWPTGLPLAGAHAAAYASAAAPTHPEGVDTVAAPAHVEMTSSLILDAAKAVLHALGAVSQAATDRTAKAISKEMERSSTKAVTLKTAAEAHVVSANAVPSVMVQQLVAREFASQFSAATAKSKGPAGTAGSPAAAGGSKQRATPQPQTAATATDQPNDADGATAGALNGAGTGASGKRNRGAAAQPKGKGGGPASQAQAGRVLRKREPKTSRKKQSAKGAPAAARKTGAGSARGNKKKKKKSSAKNPRAVDPTQGAGSAG